MKYLIITTNQKSEFGQRFCMFWKGKSESDGYTHDIREACRFEEKELPKEKFNQLGNFAIPCYALEVTEEITEKNPSTHELVELATAMEILRDID